LGNRSAMDHCVPELRTNKARPLRSPRPESIGESAYVLLPARRWFSQP
jgi:hypothetical protein